MNINSPGGCTPWDKKYWKQSIEPTQIDPALSNWLNGCTLCNFYIHEEENNYLCNRSFYNGEVRPPCNNPNFLAHPKNSVDEFYKNHSS
jgi:hypothetical protein